MISCARAKLLRDADLLARQCADALLRPERLAEAHEYARQRASTLVRLAMMRDPR